MLASYKYFMVPSLVMDVRSVLNSRLAWHRGNVPLVRFWTFLSLELAYRDELGQTHFLKKMRKLSQTLKLILLLFLL